MDKLTEIKELLSIMNKNIEKLNEKLDIMSSKLDGEVIGECKKMSIVQPKPSQQLVVITRIGIHSWEDPA